MAGVWSSKRHVGLCLAFVVVVGLLVPPIGAANAGVAPTVSGTVYDQTVTPMNNVQVWAQSGSGPDGLVIDTDTTGSDGAYTLNLTEYPSGYYIYAVDLNGGMANFSTWLWVENAVNYVRDITMEDGFGISGRVTDGSSPLAGVHVTLDGIGAVTESDGTYNLRGLRGGYNYVRFQDDTGWHVERNISVFIEGMDQTDVDVVMSPAGKISGEITDSSGSPLSGIVVSGASWSTGVSSGYTGSLSENRFQVETDTNGLYEVSVFRRVITT